MGKILLGVLVSLAACTNDPPPSCQDAIAHYYGVGCTFFDLQTNMPYTVNESILSCKDINSAVPDRCRPKFDDYLSCLDGVRSTAQCTDCSQEQDALTACQ